MTKPRFSTEDLRRLAGEGMSKPKIAKTMGCSLTWVEFHTRKLRIETYGLPGKPRKDGTIRVAPREQPVQPTPAAMLAANPFGVGK